MGAVYKEKFGTVTGKPFSKDVKVHAEVFIGNATDAPGFKLAARLKIPYESLESTKISKEDAEELSMSMRAVNLCSLTSLYSQGRARNMPVLESNQGQCRDRGHPGVINALQRCQTGATLWSSSILCASQTVCRA